MSYPYEIHLKKASPILCENAPDIGRDSVREYGFYTEVSVPQPDGESAYTLRITASHTYRLFVNGNPVAHGPARTAHGYARVDTVDLSHIMNPGVNRIAVLVTVYGNTYGGYSNDISLGVPASRGFLWAEFEDNDRVLSFTGDGNWRVTRLFERVENAERLSHCREAAEIRYLTPTSSDWLYGQADFSAPALMMGDVPTLIPRRSPLPTLTPLPFTRAVGFGRAESEQDKQIDTLFFEKPVEGQKPENALTDCRRTRDFPFDGVRCQARPDGIRLESENPDTPDEILFIQLEGSRSAVGFPYVDVTVERPGIIDVVRSELADSNGDVRYEFNNVTRIHVPAGRTRFCATEPGIARDLKIYFRGTGNVTLHGCGMRDYSYPDDSYASFSCSDKSLERLYEAARLTLKLNSLDIFMDCPDRERGGWLCDSFWTARAAQLLFGDTSVEKDFLENFLLTPGDGMFRGFFPECYPGQKSDFSAMTGITTWSFWFGCQLCEYVKRTGDTGFAQNNFARERMETFVNGVLTFIGKSGLLENLPFLFIDWSMANYGENQTPISVPANALCAKMLTDLGELYGRSDWTDCGLRLRSLLKAALLSGKRADSVRNLPDSLIPANDGHLVGRGRVSEAGLYTTLWSDLFDLDEIPETDRFLCDRTGPAPLYPHDPCVGLSQLFIGLCIRLDLLAKRGHYDELYRDLLAIYMPQLDRGPGTLWEITGPDSSSQCHGFTSHAAVHLVRDVLGVGFLSFGQSEKDGQSASPTLTVAPHVFGLSYAKGTVMTPYGFIGVSWKYDRIRSAFELDVHKPAAIDCRAVLPPETASMPAHQVKVNIR